MILFNINKPIPDINFKHLMITLFNNAKLKKMKSSRDMLKIYQKTMMMIMIAKLKKNKKVVNS